MVALAGTEHHQNRKQQQQQQQTAVDVVVGKPKAVRAARVADATVAAGAAGVAGYQVRNGDMERRDKRQQRQWASRRITTVAY